MKSKPSPKRAPKVEPVVPHVAKSAAAARAPRARKTATVPGGVHVANDVVSRGASTVVNADAAQAVVGTDHIAIRAYELFVAHGSEHGRDLEHWLAAEREMLDRS